MNIEGLDVYFILYIHVKVWIFFLKVIFFLIWPYFPTNIIANWEKKVSLDFSNAKQHHQQNRKYNVVTKTKINHWPQIRKSGPWNLVQTWTQRPGQNKQGTPGFGSRGTRTCGIRTPSGEWWEPRYTVWLSPRTRGANLPVDRCVDGLNKITTWRLKEVSTAFVYPKNMAI